MPDALIIDVVAKLPGQNLLLDGFPRTARQAKAIVGRCSRLILLSADDDTCVERILSRRVDPVTGDIYNLKTRPPSAVEVRERLTQRPFDSDESRIRARLSKFHVSIGDILAIFAGKIQVCDTVGKTPEDVAAAVRALLKQNVAGGAPGNAPAAQQQQQCVVCMASPADHLVVPCGHQCGCEACLKPLRACPICRGAVQSVVKVFAAGIADDAPAAAAVALVGEADDGGAGEAAWEQHDAAAAAKAQVQEQEHGTASQIKIEVLRCNDVATPGKEERFAVIIHPMDSQKRVPVDVCCVIDISGSMSNDAVFQDPEDETKTISQGLSMLDLVKHSVKAVISLLTENDRLSLVAFDSVAFTCFPLQHMDASRKEAAIAALEKLMPRDSTNIWAGIEAGLDSLRFAKAAPSLPGVPRKCSLLLLTDGEPQDSPPEGEAKELLAYFDRNGRTATVSTFGFGYNVKSVLLADIATCGQGQFSFLPDAKVVGTCFVNWTSNVASCIAQRAKVYVVPKDGLTVISTGPRSLEVEKAKFGFVAKIGNLGSSATWSSRQWWARGATISSAWCSRWRPRAATWSRCATRRCSPGRARPRTPSTPSTAQ